MDNFKLGDLRMSPGCQLDKPAEAMRIGYQSYNMDAPQSASLGDHYT